MQGLAALLFPAVLMLFALAMEKVQARIDRLAISRDPAEELLETTDVDPVDAVDAPGSPAALDDFRNRRVGADPFELEPASVLPTSPPRAS